MQNDNLLPQDYNINTMLDDGQVVNLTESLLPKEEKYIVATGISIDDSIIPKAIENAKDNKLTFIPYCDVNHHHVLIAVLPPKTLTSKKPPRILYFNSISDEENPSYNTGKSFLASFVDSFIDISEDRQHANACGLAVAEVASMIAKQYNDNPNAFIKIEKIQPDKKEEHYKELVRYISLDDKERELKSDEKLAIKLQIDEYYETFKPNEARDYSENKLKAALEKAETQRSNFITPPPTTHNKQQQQK